MEREPTQQEWLDFHDMVRDAKYMLCKTNYTQASITTSKSAVESALGWIKALQGSPFSIKHHQK